MNQTLLLGTYTKRESRGIYSIELNEQTRKLAGLQHAVTVSGPTYIDGNADYSLLFSIIKGEDGNGGIASYKKNDKGEFFKVDEWLQEGAPPCYVAYDEDQQLVYLANYHKGEVAVLKTSAKGELSLVDRSVHSGQSVHPNQTSPHAHYFDLTPDKQYLIACDLGTDEVYTYRLNAEQKLEQVSLEKVKPGTGPRHIVFHPNGKLAYVFGELSSEVLVFDYDAETGVLSHRQTLPSIPEEHTGFNGGAAIRVTSDGNHLYASNRGHDTIASYSIGANGELSLLAYVPTEGKTPRDFNLDPSERFVVVGHQDSDNLTLFERDPQDGSLTLLQKDVYAPEVICVKFT